MSQPNDQSPPPSISREEIIAVQRQLQTQFGAVPLAYSVDGKTFGYEAPLDYPIPAGSYVQITTPENQSFLGQIIKKSIESRQGPELTVDLGGRFAIAVEGAQVSSATARPSIRHLQGDGILLGKVADDTIESARASDIFKNAAMTPATTETIDLYLAGAVDTTPLDIGHAMYGDLTSRATLRARGFTRHTFLCGQSGSGKTYSLGVVLERLLLRTNLRMLIIDPNSDFVRLPQVRDSASAQFEGVDLDRFAAVANDVHVVRPTAGGDDKPLKIRFGDLSRAEQALVLQLDPLRDREEYSSFWRIVDQFGRDNVELGEVLDAALRDPSAESRYVSLRVRNLGISDWEIWCSENEASFIDRLDEDWRAIVLDIGTLALTAEKEVATLALLSQLWQRREERQPVLIVIDEAHNICPAEPENPLQELLTQYIIRIAGEGRKFGLYLLLSSQRPQKIHENVLSQCDNLILMRMNSSADLAHLSSVFSFVPEHLLNEASYFRQGESLVSGTFVNAPTFVAFGARMTEEGGSDVPTAWARLAHAESE